MLAAKQYNHQECDSSEEEIDDDPFADGPWRVWKAARDEPDIDILAGDYPTRGKQDDVLYTQSVTQSNSSLLTPDLEGENVSVQHERVLHKMISNTLERYRISNSFSPDSIMSLFKRQKLMHLAETVTESGNLRNLSSVIDLGAKPLSAVIGPAKGKVAD